MLAGRMLLLAALASSPPVVEKDGVRVESSVEAHVYTWRVTNLGERPLVSFEVGSSGTYLYSAPDGWAHEADEVRFRAWTADRLRAIGPGQTRAFTARVSGAAGSALGRVHASAGFEGGRVEFAEVWGPIPKRRSMVALVAGALGAIAVAHTVLLGLRERPARQPTSSREGK